MSLKNKIFSIITLGAGVVVLSTAAFAQDDKTAPAAPAAPQKAEKPFKRGEFGHRKFGRPGMPGREGFAGKRMGRGGKMRGGMMGLGRDLNLTDTQKAQIKSIMEANKPDKANFDQLKAIREARKNGTPITDEQKQQMKAFREQAQAKAKSVREQIKNVLTADQKAQIEKRREEMKTRREEMQKRFEERRQNRPAKPAAPAKPKTI